MDELDVRCSAREYFTPYDPMQMKAAFDRFQKHVWALSPLTNNTAFTNSEEKRSRQSGFEREVEFSFDKNVK